MQWIYFVYNYLKQSDLILETKMCMHIKIILFVLCFSVYCLPAHSQAILAILFGNKIHNDNISLGVYVGLEASSLTNTPGADLLPGLALGAYTNVKLKGKWTLSNYFIFKSPRGAGSVPLSDQIQSDVPGAANATIDRKITDLEISPLLRYSLTPSLSIAAGPQLAIRTISKDIYKIDLPDDGKETITYNTRSSTNWIDFDGAFDVQYAFEQGKGVRLNLRFSQGFVNVYNSNVPLNAKNQYFQLGVGIPIAIGK